VVIVVLAAGLLGGFGWAWRLVNGRKDRPPAAAESTAVKRP
jgi:hypothetical protein